MTKLSDEVLKAMARRAVDELSHGNDDFDLIHPDLPRHKDLMSAMQAAWDASPGAELAAENKRLWIMLEDCVEEMDCLMRDSGGVYGLHLNGDNAPWGELSAGGRFEEWLSAHETARAALSKLGGQHG